MSTNLAGDKLGANELRTSWGQAKLGASWVQVGFKFGGTMETSWEQIGGQAGDLSWLNKLGTGWAQNKLETNWERIKLASVWEQIKFGGGGDKLWIN